MAGLAAAISGVAQPQPNGLYRRIVQTKAVLPAIRIGEVRVIENIEELGAELQAHGFSKVEVLAQREIEILEPGILKHVPSHVSELTERRRHHNGITVGVAAKKGERFGRCARRATIHS